MSDPSFLLELAAATARPSAGEGLLVCDIQPAYDRWCHELAPRLLRHAQGLALPTVFCWVGEAKTADTEESVRQYVLEHGASPAFLEEARFVEKSYGFFRHWMDRGVAESTILAVARVLRDDDIDHSDDLDLEWLLDLDPKLCQQVPMSGAGIWLPRALETCAWMRERPWLTCGGGSGECLKELELWLRSVQVSHRRLADYVY